MNQTDGGPWTVGRTSARHHLRHGLPYTVAVHPSVSKRLAGNARLAVLERVVTDTQPPVAAIVRLTSDPLCHPGELLVDQTIRTALGLPRSTDGLGPRGDLSLVPISVSRAHRLRNFCSQALGRRYLLLRASPPDPNDIEKRICRVRPDDLVAMGADEGGRVVLFGVQVEEGRYRLVRRSLQVLALDPERDRERTTRETEEAEDRWSARYRSPRALLGVDPPDISRILLDKDDRLHLGLDQMSPVLVRRDARSAIVREAQEFGVALLASLLAVAAVLAPVLEDRGVGATWRGILVLLAGLGAATVVAVNRLRSDLR